MSDMQTIYDLNHQPQALNTMLGKGGEGEVYPLLDRPDILFKRYYPSILEKRGVELKEKIEAMRKVNVLRESKHLSWPLISAYDENKRWVGYCMYRVKGVPMFLLAHALLYKKNFPGLDRRKIARYLLNLVTQVQKLHAKNVMVGDYNLNNILCDPNSEQVALIDCDSYQITIDGRHYLCPVGSADMTAKEQQNKRFEELVRTPESEVFSLAIVLFKTLMLGRHPYDIVGGADPVENLKKGDFAYGVGNRGIPKGRWYNIWSHMPHRLKTLFIQTFTEGADNPAKRATLDEWKDALTLYVREIDKGWHVADIVTKEPKENSYRGTKSRETA